MKSFSEGITPILLIVAFALAVMVAGVYADLNSSASDPSTYSKILSVPLCLDDDRATVARFERIGKNQVLMLSCGEKKITDKPHGD